MDNDKLRIFVRDPLDTLGVNNLNHWVKIPSPCPEVPTRWYKCNDPEIWRTEAGVTIVVARR